MHHKRNGPCARNNGRVAADRELLESLVARRVRRSRPWRPCAWPQRQRPRRKGQRQGCCCLVTTADAGRRQRLDRAGVENYQITLGGDATESAAIGDRTGPGFAYDEIVPAVERIVETYLNQRESAEETFLETYRRVGMAPFKAALYPEAQANAA